MKFEFDLSHRRKWDYAAYRDHIKQLLKSNQTTGPNQEEHMIHYTHMNEVRMNRWDKTYKISESTESWVKGLQPQTWLVLTEGWCGDAAHSIPILASIAALNPEIELVLILRDENLDIMDAHLSNGARAIPKLIAIDQDQEILFEWGPRPLPIQERFLNMRKEELPGAQISKELQKIYSRSKGKDLELDLQTLSKKKAA